MGVLEESIKTSIGRKGAGSDSARSARLSGPGTVVTMLAFWFLGWLWFMGQCARTLRRS